MPVLPKSASRFRSTEMDAFKVTWKKVVIAVPSGQTRLAAIIKAGKIPLIILEGDRVHIREHENGSVFVTIPHVWADGKGNPRENSLPLCVLRDIQRSVNGLPKPASISKMPFWIDTICIPRFPRELKSEALLRMREPYEQALHVLVLDSYLRRQPASQISKFELLGLIAVCGWSQRLWTFQEGRIPREPFRTGFAFRDKSVDILKECKQPYPLLPTIPSHTVNFELSFGHNQTQMIGEAGVGFGDEYLHSVGELRKSLRTRATSRKADEAICLVAGILRFSKSHLKEILEIEDGDERMAKIWANNSKIHVGVAFSKAPRKLKIKGFRWAPATFMGNLDLSDQDGEGPNGCWGASPALILPTRLVITRPAFIPEYGEAACCRTMMRLLYSIKTPDGKIVPFCDGDGRWFNCIVEEQWHDAPVDIDRGEQMVIILEGGVDFEDQATISPQDSDRFATRGSQKGLLATCRRSIGEGNVVQTTVHRHVTMRRVSEAVDQVRSILETYADDIAVKHSEAIERVRENDTELAALIASYVTESLLKDIKTLELTMAFNSRRGWGDSKALALNDCFELVVSLVQHGSCYHLRRLKDDVTWCVD